ncbi:MAG: hypothetical protein ACK4SX_08020 [Alcanivoracaceae bacterium]
MTPRLRAFLIHLLASVLVISVVLLLVFVFWYPAPLFTYEGAWLPLRILIMVDLVAGPLLTLVVYKPGKKGLLLDMILITALQLAALGYGTHALWSQRPLAMVYAVDAWFVVGAGDIRARDIDPAIWQARPLAGPLPVFAERISDPDYLLKVLFEGAPDMHLLPAQYRPLQDHLQVLRHRATDLPALAQHSAATRQALASVDPDLLASSLALPLHGRLRSGTVLVDPDTGWPRAWLDLDLDAELTERNRQQREQERDLRQAGEDQRRGASTPP